MKIHSHTHRDSSLIFTLTADALIIGISQSHMGAMGSISYWMPRKEAAQAIESIRASIVALEGELGLHDSLAEEFERRQAEMQFHDLTD